MARELFGEMSYEHDMLDEDATKGCLLIEKPEIDLSSSVVGVVKTVTSSGGSRVLAQIPQVSEGCSEFNVVGNASVDVGLVQNVEQIVNVESCDLGVEKSGSGNEVDNVSVDVGLVPNVEQIENVESCDLGVGKIGSGNEVDNVSVDMGLGPSVEQIEKVESCDLGVGKSGSGNEVDHVSVDVGLVPIVEQIEKVESWDLGGGKSGSELMGVNVVEDKVDCGEFKGEELLKERVEEDVAVEEGSNVGERVNGVQDKVDCGEFKSEEEAKERAEEDVTMMEGSDVIVGEKEPESNIIDYEVIKSMPCIKVEGEGANKEENGKVMDRERSNEGLGMFSLGFEEWLQLPNGSGEVKKGDADELAEPLQEELCIEEQKKGSELDAGLKERKEEQNKVSGDETPKGEIGSWNVTFEDWLKLPDSVRNEHRLVKVMKGPDTTFERKDVLGNKDNVKVEPNLNVENKIVVKKEIVDVVSVQPVVVMPIVKKEVEEIVCIQPISARPIPDVEYKRMQPPRAKEKIPSKAISTVVIENGEIPDEKDWLFVGGSVVEALSTTRGRKLEDNEIVDFNFPDTKKYAFGKAARAAMSMVRFSTKRNGQIGRLPLEWANWVIPLVDSKKVKVHGRCVAAPPNLDMLKVIVLYVSFYIHSSVFTMTETSSWKIEPTQGDAIKGPLLQLFEKLNVKPFEQAEFTPKLLDSRKRSLNLEGDMEVAAIMPAAKRGVGSRQSTEANEQVISEASLNKIIGAVDVYDLKEMNPPDTLTCDLKPYQKQALYWMTESEKGVDAEEAEKILHPCWEAYHISDKRAPAIYLNIFSGEMTTKFPTSTLMARGGILADAMGLGKTVMTIALILARRGRGSPDIEESVSDDEDEMNYRKKRKMNEDRLVSGNVKGGTLIICPMALLGQWKNELEAHTVSDSISIYVHYEGGRSDNPKVLAESDVVLTTYGILQSSYKSAGENSVFHRVDWYRVVLDEAHTIKNHKSQCAQAAYTLSSYCRWCLTGTPIQNSLEDLFSLLCFLHVEPWCNWAWWNKFIRKPYENGDKQGLKLIKAILRPLMLRRSKETKDKEGRPILVLPPTDIQIIECEQSEAERDFYDALFRRSKVQFDQFVAQGKVLHNYANILELLLRLRQCCNHPFLVMSRSDTQEYADLNKLARKFLETSPENASWKGPSKAYVEEVVEGIRKGENSECPICMESPDDPVLTPCAHKMCRECLLTSWRSTTMGHCPICRQLVNKTDLITCPSKNRFRLDTEKNWKESSKITKLMECLDQIHLSRPAEKSIIFSQWTSFLDLLEIPLKRKKVQFLRFDGQLSQKHRERVLAEFNENSEKKVMLMSLRAGGVGLNLTVASNVFIMDPWWNPAVEEQAIMRIHRIGQKRTVSVRRFIVTETVEERMQQVQTRKQNMIAGALTDEDVRSARIEELKMLFR